MSEKRVFYKQMKHGDIRRECYRYALREIRRKRKLIEEAGLNWNKAKDTQAIIDLVEKK